ETSRAATTARERVARRLVGVAAARGMLARGTPPSCLADQRTKRITRMATDGRPVPIDPKRLRSQRLREGNFQGDALRLGMNWTEDDLAKPQVLVESAYGMGHPGTFHFRGLIDEVSNGVYESGGKPAEFVVSDICDGVVQATEGMSYSLISRDIMAAMIEIHALGHPHDAMVVISGNDKSVPAHLVAMARCDLPAVHVPGGTPLNAPDYVTSNRCGKLARRSGAASCRRTSSSSPSAGHARPAERVSSWGAPPPGRCCPRRSVSPFPDRRWCPNR